MDQMTLFVFGIAMLGIYILIAATLKQSFVLLIAGLLMAVLGAAWGVAMIDMGTVRQLKDLTGFGQIFVIVVSVVSGAVVSTAFAELRSWFHSRRATRNETAATHS